MYQLFSIRNPVEEVEELVIVESVRPEKLLRELVHAKDEDQCPQRYHIQYHGNHAQNEYGQE